MGVKGVINKLIVSTGRANCSEYKELVELVLDGEASSTEETYLKRHLNHCLKCLDSYNVDREIRELIKLKMAKQQVPSDLAETIRQKLIP